MKLKSTSVFLILLFIVSGSFAQMKAVIMGSSTAYGSGASSYSNSWAGRIAAFLNQNNSDGKDTIFYNIAQPGYDTYQEMPGNFIPPPGRPTPDDDYNVTKALSYNPDVIIISLPSNDINYGYSKAEMINNLRLMSATIFAQGVRCYVTTPQPRNDMDQSHRDSLRSLVDSVNASFGAYAIDFWSSLVTSDGLNMLKDEYRAMPSELHLNDDGHELLFEKIRDAYIFGLAGPLALQLTGLQAQLQNDRVLIKWHIEQQAPNTSFELQRSINGSTFETILTQTIAEARASYNYSAIDQTPLSGKSFYRIKITEAGRISYSGIIDISSKGNSLNVSTIYVDNSGSNLVVQVNIQKSQFVNMSIIANTGAILSTQKIFINQPGNTITIPVGTMASGQYYLRLVSSDGRVLTNIFMK